jgi:hypothetical protein
MIHTKLPAFVAYMLQLIISSVITSRILFPDWSCAFMELTGLVCNISVTAKEKFLEEPK